jgi:hypothetical protein
MPSDEQMEAIKNRIKNMPDEIRMLEPVDPKYRTVKNLKGENVILDDRVNVGLIDPNKYMPMGSAWSDRNGFYIDPQFIGTQIQDHEYIHTLVFRNKLLDDGVNNGVYNPPWLFFHAGDNNINEQLTMMLTAYDKNRDTWVNNISTSYKFGEDMTEEKARAGVEEVDRFLRSIGLW